MNLRHLLAISGLTAFCLAGFAHADEGRYIQENGITYYDIYRTVPRTINETSLQQTTRTVYKVQSNTETRDVTRTWWCPVTTYRTETEMVGRWNFFIEPYYETKLVPETRWVLHSEVVKMPVTCQKLVPETQTVQVPVTNQKIVNDTVLVSRVIVSVPSSAASSAATPVVGPVARPTVQNTPVQTTLPQYQPLKPGEQIGGISRLSSDPPRYGTSPATTSTTTPATR
jgi:hypothetical protein